MTDYARPTTPTEVLEHIGRDVEYREQRLRREAEALLKQADALLTIRMEVIEQAAYQYEKWQPPIDSASDATI